MIRRTFLVFVLAIVCEGFYTAYAYFTARADLIKAPLASGGIAVFKGILVCLYVREPIHIAALAVGQVIGTFLTLKLIHKG
jgi:hypothetical protein